MRCIPFALSLSKGNYAFCLHQMGFDKLSPNGG
jgi:hypothetical protein